MTDFSLKFPKSGSTFAYTPENVANKVTSINVASSNTEYPSAKLIYDQLLLKKDVANTAIALSDSATINLTNTKHTLTSSSPTRTFTISYIGDDITIELILNTTSAIYTFPITSLCISEGIASGDNTASLIGASGDKYILSIKKIGANYYIACKNFGQ